MAYNNNPDKVLLSYLEAIYMHYCLAGAVGSNNPFFMSQLQFEDFVKAGEYSILRAPKQQAEI